ncbi:hypothetical protein OBK24_01545 [Empedobacter falsenii]|uniref:hypothetical protein n=1 Tax=Algoriella xinjiangensis TaxID=684065 RepID=UPI000F63D66E|nr:hypothetical protein [Algoriella xinjiangensis]VDH16692.1 Uncharacterised protein [Algoriella xinjiangensis]
MDLEIEIIGNKNSEKYKHALEIKEVFDKLIMNIKNQIIIKKINSFELIYHPTFDRIPSGKLLIICNEHFAGYASKKIDLILIGEFDTFKPFYTKVKTNVNYYSHNIYRYREDEFKFESRLVNIKNFCYTISIKEDMIDDLKFNDNNMIVDLGNEMISDNRLLLLDFFRNNLNYSPFICHFNWYKNITKEQFPKIFYKKNLILKKINYLSSVITFTQMIQLGCWQKIPNFPIDKHGYIKGIPIFKSFKRFDILDFSKIKSEFNKFS